jgi:hypothetical protein
MILTNWSSKRIFLCPNKVRNEKLQNIDYPRIYNYQTSELLNLRSYILSDLKFKRSDVWDFSTKSYEALKLIKILAVREKNKNTFCIVYRYYIYLFFQYGKCYYYIESLIESWNLRLVMYLNLGFNSISKIQ